MQILSLPHAGKIAVVILVAGATWVSAYALYQLFGLDWFGLLDRIGFYLVVLLAIGSAVCFRAALRRDSARC